MVTMQSRFRLNQQEASASSIDGEAIMMNLATGVYYTTDAVGARIWELAAAAYSPDEIGEILAGEYEVGPDQARADTLELVGKFVDEELVRPADPVRVPELPRTDPARDKKPYAHPTLEIYREMGHLLALDPPMPGLENISWGDAPAGPTQTGS